MDYRTEGSRGTNESDGVMENRVADTSGATSFVTDALDDAPMPELPMNGSSAAGVRADQGQDGSKNYLQGLCRIRVLTYHLPTGWCYRRR